MDEGGRGRSQVTGGGGLPQRGTLVAPACPGALEVFRRELGDLWPYVGERCVLLDVDEMTALSERLERHMREHPQVAERVLELANDLMALLAGWAHFGPEERQVLAGAMSYLSALDDAVPDDQPGGLDDDDRVVRAAVRAVMRRRARG